MSAVFVYARIHARKEKHIVSTSNTIRSSAKTSPKARERERVVFLTKKKVIEET